MFDSLLIFYVAGQWPYISLPQGKGLKLMIAEEKDKRLSGDKGCDSCCSTQAARNWFPPGDWTPQAQWLSPQKVGLLFKYTKIIFCTVDLRSMFQLS